MKDFPWGEPDKTTIAYPTDVCIRKPATSVVFVARAHAPQGKPVPTFDAYAQVGSLRKAIQIHGLRVWEVDGVGLPPARPVAELEVRYEHVGRVRRDLGSGKKEVARRGAQPHGQGLRPQPKLADRPTWAPNRSSAAPIRSWRTRPPLPAWGQSCVTGSPGVASRGRTTRSGRRRGRRSCPRTSTIGSTCCASPGLIADPPMRSGEEVKLLNLVPGGGPTLFALPRVTLGIEFRAGRLEPQSFRPSLDTVLIDLHAVHPGAGHRRRDGVARGHPGAKVRQIGAGRGPRGEAVKTLAVVLGVGARTSVGSLGAPHGLPPSGGRCGLPRATLLDNEDEPVTMAVFCSC